MTFFNSDVHKSQELPRCRELQIKRYNLLGSGEKITGNPRLEQKAIKARVLSVRTHVHRYRRKFVMIERYLFSFKGLNVISRFLTPLELLKLRGDISHQGMQCSMQI